MNGCCGRSAGFCKELFVESVQRQMDGRKRVYGCSNRRRYGFNLLHSKSKREVVTIGHTTTVVEAVETLKKYDFSQAPVVDGDALLGILTEKSLLHHAIKGHAGQEQVRELIDMDFCVVHADTELHVLMELFFVDLKRLWYTKTRNHATSSLG